MLASCGSGGEESAADPTNTSTDAQTDAPIDAQTAAPETPAASFPRTIEVDDGTTVSIGAEPVRIAALSTDVAEVAIALAGADRLVAVPETNATAAVGSDPAAAGTVEHRLSFGDRVDRDLLASWDTDLVLISPNHPEERELSEALAGGSVPILVMPNSWDDLDDVRTNIDLIAQAIGAESDAAEIIDDMTRREEAVRDRVAAVETRPVVLILTNVAQVPFLVGPGTTTHSLVETAGGTNAADLLQVTTTISGVGANQIATADPDAILLVDGLGTGREAFAPLLDSPELAGLDAIADDNVLVLPARDTFGVAHTLVNGLEAIADWLHPPTG
ncbi:MAG: ABC transporter substrate-binding protein [Actinomycetota bacterium]